MTKKCKACGREFYVKTNKPLYCSKYCSNTEDAMNSIEKEDLSGIAKELHNDPEFRALAYKLKTRGKGDLKR